MVENVLGDAWADLDPDVRFFLGASDSRFTGRFTITNGNWAPSRIAARLLRLPRPGKNVPVALVRCDNGGREIWDRRFPDVTLRSEQWAEDGLIVERMGIVVCRFRLRVLGAALMIQHDSTFFAVSGLRVRLPRFLAPTIQAYVDPSPEPMATFVHVALSLPLVRTVLAYSGTVKQV